MRACTPIPCIPAAAVLLVFAGVAMASGQEPGLPAPASVTVGKAPLKLEVTLSGVFEAAQAHEIALRPESWTELVVERAVPEGTRVEAQEPVLWLETDRIDKAIRDLALELELGALALRQGGLELESLKAGLPLDMEAAERAQRQAAEDLESFLTVDRGQSERQAAVSVRDAERALEYAREELEQLEKMYTADDLTEETEEIVLTRARHEVESAEFRLEVTRVRAEKTLETELPRRHRDLERDARLQELAWRKAQRVLPLELERKQVEVARQEVGQKDSEERRGWLEADRVALVVKAPASGVVYYGNCERGRWPNGAKMAEQLRPGGRIQPREVVMTVVCPRPMRIRAEVPEKDLGSIQAGLTGKARPTGFPDVVIPVKVESVTRIPVAPGMFEAVLSIGGPEVEALMPGMACSVTFVPYFQTEALLVPSAAVFADALDESMRHVFLKTGEGASEKRAVTTGKTVGDKTEILTGLAAGDEILLADPTAGAR